MGKSYILTIKLINFYLWKFQTIVLFMKWSYLSWNNYKVVKSIHTKFTFCLLIMLWNNRNKYAFESFTGISRAELILLVVVRIWFWRIWIFRVFRGSYFFQISSGRYSACGCELQFSYCCQSCPIWWEFQFWWESNVDAYFLFEPEDTGRLDLSPDFGIASPHASGLKKGFTFDTARMYNKRHSRY